LRGIGNDLKQSTPLRGAVLNLHRYKMGLIKNKKIAKMNSFFVNYG
jgi:hypothetical protein